jgi:hypothetical protein
MLKKNELDSNKMAVISVRTYLGLSNPNTYCNLARANAGQTNIKPGCFTHFMHTNYCDRRDEIFPFHV